MPETTSDAAEVATADAATSEATATGGGAARDDEPVGGPGASPERRRPLVVALVALAAALAVALGALAVSLAGDEEDDVRAAAIAFMVELTTWDAADGLDQTTEALRAMGTGAFLDEVDAVLGSEVRATAEQLGAVSRGEVVEVVVDDVGDDGSWTAIAFVEQELSVAGVTEAQEQIARLVLVEVDGRWLVEVLELLNAPTPLGEPTGGGR